MKKLIATDYDGTFMRNGHVYRGDRKKLAEWRSAGNYFGFVTGRGADFPKLIKKKRIPADFFIVYNGSMIIDAKGNTVYEAFIDRNTFLELQEFFSHFSDCMDYSTADDNDNFRHHYSRFPTVERALEVAEECRKIFGDRVNIFVNGCHINIGTKGTGKKESISIIAEHFGLDLSEAAVVGDDFNDLDMLTAHDGWAVTTARPEILKIVNHTCKSVGTLAEELMHNSKAE